MNISFVMVTAEGQSRELPPMHLPISIGRSEDCKLRIPLSAVSRHHCELIEDDDELVVRDLKSSNGTFVNKERLTKQRELVPGDLLAVGPVVLVVRIDGHPKAIDPIIAFANGAVSPGEGGGHAMDGVPTWSGQMNPTTPAGGVPAAGPATAPAPRPAAKPAVPPKPKADDDSFEKLLADLSESDFDIDLPDDDDPKPAKPGPKK